MIMILETAPPTSYGMNHEHEPGMNLKKKTEWLGLCRLVGEDPRDQDPGT